MRVFYGTGELPRLARCQRVVLQPGHHGRADLAALAAHGTEALAYLSLSEDTGPTAAWQLAERNDRWGGHFVDVAHPGWQRSLTERAERALEDGFAGVFLDTLDAPQRDPPARAPLLDLVRRIRATIGERTLIANRGFELQPDLSRLADAFLFEAFSTTWENGYRALRPLELLANVELLNRLRVTNLQVFALDYAVTESLAAFAVARAATHGLPLQVSNRELTWLD